MTPTARKRPIRIAHRRILRREGEPAPLCDDERKEIQRRVDAGENAVDMAREFGCMLRQVHSVMRNAAYHRGYGFELSRWQRQKLENL